MKYIAVTAFAAMLMSPITAGAGPNEDREISAIGVGPHGYDWAVGTWSCTNSMPSAIGGPADSSYTLTRSREGALYVHSTGEHFDMSNYIVYDAKNKSWSLPGSGADGSFFTETTQRTGQNIVWDGPYYESTSATPKPMRDTYTFASLRRYRDVTEMQADGTWKTVADLTCTKE